MSLFCLNFKKMKQNYTLLKFSILDLNLKLEFCEEKLITNILLLITVIFANEPASLA